MTTATIKTEAFIDRSINEWYGEKSLATLSDIDAVADPILGGP